LTGTALPLALCTFAFPGPSSGATAGALQLDVAALADTEVAGAKQLPAGPMPDGSTLAAALQGAGGAEAAGLTPAPDTQAPDAPGKKAHRSAPKKPSKSAAVPAPERDLAEPPTDAVESLRDAIVAALKGNPDIQIALAQQDDAYYGIAEARAPWMPHLDASVGYGRELAKTGTSAATRENRLEGTVTLAQNIWDFGVTMNDVRRARASYRSAQWAVREKIEAISYGISSAYVGVLQQQMLVALALEEIEADKRVLHMVTVQKDLGLTTSADISRAQAQIDGTQSLVLDRKSALQQARIAYRRLTGHLPANARELAPAVAMLPASVDDAVDMIDDHSPRMAQAVEDRRSLARQQASESGAFFPHVSLLVQANHKYDVLGKTGMADDARAMVTISYNLLNGGADLALRRRIGARIREADYELDRRRREVEESVRTDYDALDAARKKIATIDAEIASAEKVVDLYRQQFREGRRTVFEVLDSEKTLYAARANQIVNHAAMNLAEYRVLQGLGGLFDLVSGGDKLPPEAMEPDDR
jgi:TolC family type I secretion outer membrane protein